MLVYPTKTYASIAFIVSLPDNKYIISVWSHDLNKQLSTSFAYECDVLHNNGCRHIL